MTQRLQYRSQSPTGGPNLRSAVSEPARWLPDTRYSFAVAAMVWLLALMMTVPDGFDYASLELGQSPGSGSAGSRMIWLSLLGLSGIVVLWRASLAAQMLRRLNPFLILLILLIAASVSWSIEPVVTLRRAIRLGTILLVATAFVLVGWHARRFQSVLRGLIAGLLLGSLLFGLLQPALAIHQMALAEVEGAWHGLANHKNTLGAIAALGMLLWLHAMLARECKTWLGLIAFSAALTCLLLSRSSTALMASLFSMALLPMLMRSPKALRAWMPWMIAAFALVLTVYALAVLRLVPGLEVLLKPVAALTGKDLSFTGRSEIWTIVSEQVREHPWLGSGYGAYWTGPYAGSPSAVFLDRMYFYPGSSHNGYLEIVNDLGAVGLMLLFGFFASYLHQSLQLFHQDRELGALYLTLFFQQAVINLSESHWFNVLSFGFLVMTLATLSLARIGLDRWLLQVFGPQPLSMATPTTAAPRYRVSRGYA